jgi:hypothetical protein
VRKVLAHLVHVVQHGQHRAALVVPGVQQGQQVAAGAGVYPGKGLVQQDDGRVLQHQPGKQRPLKLPARQCGNGALAKPAQAHLGQGIGAALALGAAVATQRTHLVPQAHGHHVGHGDGKAVVHVVALGKVGHALARQPVDVPLHGPHQPRQCLDEGGLARAVGPHHGHQRTGW